jgi:RNA polymerase sigma factor for flagellar operon FliA
LDELRSIDWVPRSVRAKVRVYDRAYATLEAILHRVPTDDELAKEMEIPVEQLRATLTHIDTVVLTPLDERLHVDGERATELCVTDTLKDRSESPDAAYEVEEMRRVLADAIDLPEREKIVATLYYYEALTLAEIGQVLGVTESRVCQIHTKAVLQLRSRLAVAPG